MQTIKKLFFILCFFAVLSPTAIIAVGNVMPGGQCCSDSCLSGSACQCNPSADCEIDTATGKITKGKPGICVPSGKEWICPSTTYTSIEDVATTISNYLFYLAVVVCPLIIVIGAFTFLFSAGDMNRTRLGRSMITWAVIGLAAILLAKGLFYMIKSVILG